MTKEQAKKRTKNYPSNGEILRELYYRFRQEAERRHADPAFDVIQTTQMPRIRVRTRGIVDHYVFLKAAYKAAKTLWIPYELERRRNQLRKAGRIEEADWLTELKPDTKMIRFLYDHPKTLPSLVSDDDGFTPTPYEALAWLHFELYPSLRKRFLSGNWPAVKDFPETTLGKLSVERRGGQQASETRGETDTKSGRKPKYDMAFLKRVRDTYEQELNKGIGSKGAWNEAAKVHGLESGEAARKQCKRYLEEKRNRGQN